MRRPGLFVAALCASLLARASDPEAGRIEETPLAPRSGPSGTTMFVELDPAETGVVTTNDYADPEMWGRYYQELTFGTMGSGVAVGDYDNDGRPDIFAASKTESCRLFRNLGDWKFVDVTEAAGLAPSPGGWASMIKGWFGLGDDTETAGAGGAWNQGVTFADVNNDGWLDIYLCRFAAANRLYINQGNGIFVEEAEARGLAVNDASGMAAFCDYDRDGWLDVHVQTNMLSAAEHPDGQRDYLFRNNGDGTFADVTDRAGIAGETSGHSATWWDHDQDGWPDLYVANDYGKPDNLYRNNRDGTFTDVINDVVPRMPYYSMGSDLGDVNSDGLVDFIVADMAPTSREKDQRGMAGSRSRAQGNPALPGEAPQYMYSALYVNTGAERFLEAAHLAGVAATDWTWSPRLEDLDNDGRLDLHVTNGMNREYHNTDILDRIMMAEDLTEPRRVMRASPPLSETNLAFRNLGDLEFEKTGAAWGLDRNGVSFGSAFADFDGDGDLDLVHANFGAGVSLLRNDSATGHRAIFSLRGTRSNRFGVGTSIRIESASGVQVRQLVLARGSLSSSGHELHFGLGSDASIERLAVSWPSGHVQTFSGLPVDRRFVIVEPAGPAPSPDVGEPVKPGLFSRADDGLGLSVEIPETTANETVQQPLLPRRFDREGPGLAVADLDGDGREDIILAGNTASPARILSRGADTVFTGREVRAFQSVVDDGPILVFDADGDDRPDVLVTRGGASLPAGAPDYQPQLYLNDGHGGFFPAPDGVLPRLSICTGAAAVADFDRDGRLDVFIGARLLPGQYPLAARSALLANRGGRFEDVTNAAAPALGEAGLVTSALWSDVDGDGWLDLLVALEWGTVRYFRSNGGKSFDDWSERAGFAAAGKGWWSSLASADFNGDGRPDIVAGNVGLNTPYRADREHPAVLFLGEFRRGGGPLLVEAAHENGRLYPWRTRNELGAQLPAILKRFPRNDDFARAPIEEVLDAGRLAAARRFEAAELRSGVFLSRDDGTHQFVPLPRVAQVAPARGMAAGDFDGDGKADLYLLQNDFSPADFVGRFLGGASQLLRGDGDGGFEAVGLAESGLLVPGDAKALAVLDVDADGWPDFLATQNAGKTVAFRNNGRAGHRSIAVRLNGSAGNRTAIGARLRLVLSDGSSQTWEIQAGTGHQSQSSPLAFFGFEATNPPEILTIRWPSGEVTTHDVSAGGSTLELSAH